ncbi:MFS transporter, partial [Porticoccaceae bacterium]|nr:MFS transporter [Porticoccaceae bacterium]
FLAGSFFLSSALNFFLAIIILTAEPGTELFNQQLGRMLALSLPVNALPAMLVNIANLVYVSRGIKRLTSLTLEEILIIDTENAK